MNQTNCNGFWCGCCPAQEQSCGCGCDCGGVQANRCALNSACEECTSCRCGISGASMSVLSVCPGEQNGCYSCGCGR